MNKNNFNSIDKIKTPDYWKAKALNIPCTQIKKSNTKYYNYYRLATSFCLTVVCLVSIILFAHMNKVLQPNTIISNKPYVTTTTDFGIRNTETSPNNNKKHDITSNNQNNTAPQRSTLEPSEKDETTVPTTNSTEKPTSSITTSPTINETSPATVSTEKMTTATTEPSTQKPTEKPKNIIFNGSHNIENAWGVNDVDVYCKVFDSNGNLLGSADLFDFQHEAVFDREHNNVEYYSYYASEKGLTFTQGYYTYVFYKRNGSVICSGTQYVS